MGYRSIVISSAVRLTVKNQQLIIEGEASGTVPIEDIRTLMIESRSASITTYALSLLSEEGVCVYICDEKHEKRLRAALPDNGSVRLLIVTEKQYESIRVLVGKLKEEEKQPAYEQLSLF